MGKKPFLSEPSVAEIKQRDSRISRNNVVLELQNLDEDEYLITASPLLGAYQNEPIKFLKHGAEVPIHRYRTIAQAERDRRIPLDLRRRAYEQVRERAVDFSCYSFMPLIGNETRRRRISLVQILDGARIYAYSQQQQGVEIKVVPYDNARGVKKDGASVIVDVPSAEKKSPRNKFKFTSVVVADDVRKFAIAHGLGSDHTCEFKRYRGLRYPFEHEKETSQVLNFCKHEVAGYIGLVDWYWNQEHNLMPLEMSEFALPSKRTVELYKRMLDSLLIYDSTIKCKDNLRKPNQAEKQVLLDRVVKTFGYDATLFCDSKRDGLLANYNWDLRA